MKFLTCFCFLLAAGCLAVNACDLNQGTIMEYVTSCMRESPKLAMEIAMHMGNPRALESTKFLCDNDEEIAKLFVCLEHHLAGCIPEESRDLMMGIMPTYSSLIRGFNLLCKHKNAMDGKCFVPQMTSFMQCYQKKLQSPAIQSLAVVKDPKAILCSVIRAEEQCFEDNRGSCSEDFINMVKNVLETVFPIQHCAAYPHVNRSRDYALHFKSMKH